MYLNRIIDRYLSNWANRSLHKPVLLRGARQVGKSTAVRHLGESFDNFIEINFERQPEYMEIFRNNLVAPRITAEISALSGIPVQPGKTLLFLDEIQMCPEAIMSLRFFKEELPELHVIAAGSLLEFALAELPTFGVGRIHSMFMYPMTFDEFLEATGNKPLIDARDNASFDNPLSEPLHTKLIELLRTYMIVGGMPEVVATWIKTNDYLQCQEIQEDLLISYEDDFPKYKKKIDPHLLRLTFRSAAVQATHKFVYSEVGSGYRPEEVKKALDMLILAGLVIPVTRSDASGFPLGASANDKYRKMLLLDPGLLLRMLNMQTGESREMDTHILTATVAELVNKGPMAELIAGLEMIRYASPNIRHELYYWMRPAKNSQAEVDYVTPFESKILPIEVKAGTRGGMKSLWLFMGVKHLSTAVRMSLENFGKFQYEDSDTEARYNVLCLPLYAVSMMSTQLRTLNS